jgi:hypothetical protein
VTIKKVTQRTDFATSVFLDVNAVSSTCLRRQTMLPQLFKRSIYKLSTANKKFMLESTDQVEDDALHEKQLNNVDADNFT